MTALPIDLIPDTHPPRFRWRSAVSIPGAGGTRVVEQEGRLPSSVEGAVADLVTLAKRMDQRINNPDGLLAVLAKTSQLRDAVQELASKCDKLQAFKDWTHSYLDAHEVPEEFPDGLHTKEGCRIGDRMDWLVAELTKARAMNEELAECVAKQSELLSKRAEKQEPQPTPTRKK